MNGRLPFNKDIHHPGGEAREPRQMGRQELEDEQAPPPQLPYRKRPTPIIEPPPLPPRGQRMAAQGLDLPPQRISSCKALLQKLHASQSPTAGASQSWEPLSWSVPSKLVTDPLQNSPQSLVQRVPQRFVARASMTCPPPVWVPQSLGPQCVKSRIAAKLTLPFATREISQPPEPRAPPAFKKVEETTSRFESLKLETESVDDPLDAETISRIQVWLVNQGPPYDPMEDTLETEV